MISGNIKLQQGVAERWGLEMKRFKLDLYNGGLVEITDTFLGGSRVVKNTDKDIRDGIKHFYNIDSFRLDLNEDEQEHYVKVMMGYLPKEDLSMKGGE